MFPCGYKELDVVILMAAEDSLERLGQGLLLIGSSHMLGTRPPLRLCPCSSCWECVLPHSSVRGAAPPLLQVLAQTVSSLRACYHFMKNPNSLFPVPPALLRPISPPLTQHLPCILLHYLGNCHHHLPRPPERRFSAERDRGHLGSFNPGPRAVLSVVHNTKQKLFSDGTTFL